MEVLLLQVLVTQATDRPFRDSGAFQNLEVGYGACAPLSGEGGHWRSVAVSTPRLGAEHEPEPGGLVGHMWETACELS